VKDDTIGNFAVGFLFIIGAGYIFSSSWFDVPWYAVEYSVDPFKVQVGNKPKDCDFMHAPLGRKECHYDAKATAYNAAGDIVGGDSAPQYRNDIKTGKAIVSYDDGKTWEWYYGANIPDQKIKTVLVTWSKVTD
jgi:hypothetical protein